ncbi:MAG: Ycf48-like protein, partial [Pseudomonadota bacterium]
TWHRRLDGRRLAQLALDAAKASGDARQLRDAERLVADGPDKPFLDVAMWDAQRLLAVGAYGIALHSADGGQTWSVWMNRLPNPKGLHIYVLRRQGSTMLLAGEQGLLMRSDDDGATFKPLVSPYRGSWFAGEVLPSGEWVLGGLRGNIWRSGDQGVTWTQMSVPMSASVTGMAVGASGELLVANQAGHVLRRAGDRLVPTTPEALAPLAGLSPLPGGELLTYGVAGLAVMGGSSASGR